MPCGLLSDISVPVIRPPPISTLLKDGTSSAFSPSAVNPKYDISAAPAFSPDIVPTVPISPLAIFPITLFAKPPPFASDESNIFPPIPPFFVPFAFLTALPVIPLPTIPESPPLNAAVLTDVPLDLPAETLLPPPLNVLPMLLAVIRTSANIDPPVCPTFIPREDIKLSIFCDTFRNATAQRNQTKIFPVTPSLPIRVTSFCTSFSVRAKTDTENIPTRTAADIINLKYFFI